MEFSYTEVKLVTAFDREMARRQVIDQGEVRQMNVTVRADTGALFLTINERIQDILQFPFLRKEKRRTADDKKIEFDVVGPVHLEWQNRSSCCSAIVMPGDTEPLLGGIPMEEMDITFSMKQLKLIGKHHPDYPLLRL